MLTGITLSPAITQVFAAGGIAAAGFAAIWAIGKVIAVLKDGDYDNSSIADLCDDSDLMPLSHDKWLASRNDPDNPFN